MIMQPAQNTRWRLVSSYGHFEKSKFHKDRQDIKEEASAELDMKAKVRDYMWGFKRKTNV